MRKSAISLVLAISVLSETDPVMLLTTHDKIKVKKDWVSDATVKKCSKFNALVGTASTVIQIMWYVKNWKAGQL